jgi:ribonuclease HI
MTKKFIDKIEIFIDGAARGNPGSAAIGFMIYDSDGNLIEKQSECIGVCTNNMAEYKALIKALDVASSHTREEIICFMDSELVIRQMNFSYKIKKPHLKELFQQVKMKESMYKKVIYQHLPREHPKMVMVDKLVNMALDKIDT